MVKKENSSRVYCRGQLVVRLIAIEYYERLFHHLFFYLNLLMSDFWLDLELWSRLRNEISDLDLMLRPLIQRWYIAFVPVFFIQCLLIIVIIIIICFWHCSNICAWSIIWLENYSYALTIFSEIQVVKDIICPLINHALTSNHLSRSCIYPIRLSRVMYRLSSIKLCYWAHCLK